LQVAQHLEGLRRGSEWAVNKLGEQARR
jgi:hypothetical protein